MKTIYLFLIVLFIGILPAFAQDQQRANDIVLKMQHDLNLSQDQVANITQIVNRYVMASNDLEKSIADGSMNPSSVDSQRQQIKAAESQGIAQYLRSDQLSQWNNLESQIDAPKDKSDSEDNGTPKPGASDAADGYSNLPKSGITQN